MLLSVTFFASLILVSSLEQASTWYICRPFAGWNSIVMDTNKQSWIRSLQPATPMSDLFCKGVWSICFIRWLYTYFHGNSVTIKYPQLLWNLRTTCYRLKCLAYRLIAKLIILCALYANMAAKTVSDLEIVIFTLPSILCVIGTPLFVR